MPELPDITVYVSALEVRIRGSCLDAVRLSSPFLLRTVDPPLDSVIGRRVVALQRLGKRIVIELDGGCFLVLHLMVAGRLHWKKRGAKAPGKRGLACFDFESGTLVLTEAGTRKRASLHVVGNRSALAAHDPGGVEPLACDFETFVAVLRSENHTLKRALTDPHLLSGIGNAYSDEILHAARLSPTKRSASLGDGELRRLFDATRDILTRWTDRLSREAGEEFPEHVTAFREGMAVHGRYREPCPVCAAPVQRIVYASNEAYYCARCQTGGKLLADRALSKLLKGDWPKTLDELEERRR